MNQRVEWRSATAVERRMIWSIELRASPDLLCRFRFSAIRTAAPVAHERRLGCTGIVNCRCFLAKLTSNSSRSGREIG